MKYQIPGTIFRLQNYWLRVSGIANELTNPSHNSNAAAIAANFVCISLRKPARRDIVYAFRTRSAANLKTYVKSDLAFCQQAVDDLLQSCILFGSISSSRSWYKSPVKRCIFHAVPLWWNRWRTSTEMTEVRCMASYMFGREAPGGEFLQSLSVDWSYDFAKPTGRLFPYFNVFAHALWRV